MVGATSIWGERWLYGIVASIEEGVDRHYDKQLAQLEGDEQYRELYSFLDACRLEECEHRDEAIALRGKNSFFLSLWCASLGAGSALATGITRRL
ncbi:hypothetical protein MASR2M78_06610 [Treponema sp.]